MLSMVHLDPSALLVLLVIGVALALLMAALYTPWAVGLLRFAPLPAHELAVACGLGLLSVVWFEGVKWVRRRAGPATRGGQAGTSPSS